MKYLVAILLFSAVGLGAASKLYSVSPVKSEVDAVACFKSGGKAVMIADLAPTGELASEWVTGCLVEATSKEVK